MYPERFKRFQGLVSCAFWGVNIHGGSLDDGVGDDHDDSGLTVWSEFLSKCYDLNHRDNSTVPRKDAGLRAKSYHRYTIRIASSTCACLEWAGVG